MSPGWSAGVFGLDLHGRFPAPGLAGLGSPDRAPRVDVALVCDEELATGWPAEGATRVVDWRFDDGAAATTIDWHEHAGYRVFAAGYGQFRIGTDASRIDCAPAAVEPWQWQRYLLGQVLPITAVLHGYEVLHASAVACDGRALAFVAGSGVGKTSLALNMVLRGHGFITDDVVTVSLDDRVPMVHPGPAVTNLREAENERIGAPAARLGEVVGRDAHGLRVALTRTERMLPLAAMYLLERAAAGADAAFARVDPSFRLLFANSFDFLIGSPQRMRKQLEVYAALADAVPIFRVSIPPGVDATALAALVEAHSGTRGKGV